MDASTVATVRLGDGRSAEPAGDLAELASALATECRRPGVGAVLVEAGGQVLAPTDGDPAAYDAAQRVGQALQRAALPAVLAVSGPVRGAGLAALLTFDVAVCHPDATLATGGAEAMLGSGLAWPLHRALGPARARTLALTGRVLTATAAQEWGLVAEVDPDWRDRAARIAGAWTADPGAALVRRAFEAAERLEAAESYAFGRELRALCDPPT